MNILNDNLNFLIIGEIPQQRLNVPSKNWNKIVLERIERERERERERVKLGRKLIIHFSAGALQTVLIPINDYFKKDGAEFFSFALLIEAVALSIRKNSPSGLGLVNAS